MEIPPELKEFAKDGKIEVALEHIDKDHPFVSLPLSL
jgi:hypothetical protein